MILSHKAIVKITVLPIPVGETSESANLDFLLEIHNLASNWYYFTPLDV